MPSFCIKVGVVVKPFKNPSLKPSSISFKLAESKYNSILYKLECKETKKKWIFEYWAVLIYFWNCQQYISSVWLPGTKKAPFYRALKSPECFLLFSVCPKTLCLDGKVQFRPDCYRIRVKLILLKVGVQLRLGECGADGDLVRGLARASSQSVERLIFR
jgi:hypothetical protein